MSGKPEIPPTYRRRSCPVFAPRSESGPCQRAEEEGRSYAGGQGEAAGKGPGTKGKVVHGLENRGGFNHPTKAKCSASGNSSGLTRSEVMKCLTKKTVTVPLASIRPPPSLKQQTKMIKEVGSQSETEQYYTTNFRKKFLSTKEFFEKTNKHKKQQAEISEPHFTHRGSGKSKSHLPIHPCFVALSYQATGC